MRISAFFWAVFAPVLPVFAQQTGIDQDLEFIKPDGLPPFIRWHAKPGRTYFTQVSSQTDPNDPNSKPPSEWFVLTGDSAVNIPKTRSRTITIPKGQSRLVVVLLASDEFSMFTDPESGFYGEFNDNLTWIFFGGSTASNGSVDVNSRHDDWVIDENNGTSQFNFPVVHWEECKSIQAPTNADLNITITLSATNIGDGSHPSTVMVGVLPIDIKPDANMAGVIGDEIKSLKTGSAVKHFVTPKKSTELDQPFVELKAVGVDVATFYKLLEWEGGEAGSTIDRRKVSRDATGKTEVKLKLKNGGAVAVTMQVWVVWATVTATPGTASFIQIPASGMAQWEIGKTATTCWRFKFKIEPAAICDFTVIEIPDLTGPLGKPVPGAGKPFPTEPAEPGDSASKKWDVSRQAKWTIRNPQGIPKADLMQPGQPVAWFINQPLAVDSPVGFPTNPNEGNDDPPFPDEDGEPYLVKTGDGLDHAIGEISSLDTPYFSVLNSWGAAGRTFAKEMK